MKKTIAVLGSTGSIGVQSLDVAEKSGYTVDAITANKDFKTLEAQIRKFKPRFAALADTAAAAELRLRVRDTATKVYSGAEGVCLCAEESDADTAIDSIVGLAGLLPAMKILESGKTLALANKEALVAGGHLVLDAAKKTGKQILPVDSEHSAIFQCLEGKPSNKALKKIILTASGGPFFGKTKDEIKNVTAADALKHPTWDMGAKITIDSASMFNKGLELIEAHFLFGVAPEDIDILVHRESIIHSMVMYDDNSVIAQLGLSDMRIPIQYALTYPERYPSPVGELDLSEIGKLTFFKPDYEVFDCLGICREAITRGGLYPAAVNSANEEANRLFREGKIGFTDLGRLIRTAFSVTPDKKDYTLSDIFETDKAARQAVHDNI
ncbi:MAG: 1-deoxy-D-xylulose-5-phosphate reductoisomerase [Ruminococcaceae bacterium]|nr:1-deoxy-D-xylulose-5-phosphate reductoisomerase [Oscillospiraceae bacterium]MBR3597556.1 1-deoxy-D-xylulose-5-phosphate reductoisomerase [Clostridia bacterium]